MHRDHFDLEVRLASTTEALLFYTRYEDSVQRTELTKGMESNHADRVKREEKNQLGWCLEGALLLEFPLSPVQHHRRMRC